MAHGRLPIGDAYQQATKCHRGQGEELGPGVPAAVEETTRLPKPAAGGGEGLWGVIQARRSVREFRRTPLTLGQLSQLLWATQGVTAVHHGHAFRAAPSAGACYPIDTHVVVHRVEGLEAGLYRYNVDQACLERLRRADLSGAIASACLDQEMAAEAAVVFVWAAVPARSKHRKAHGAAPRRTCFVGCGAVGDAADSLDSCPLGMSRIGHMPDGSRSYKAGPRSRVAVPLRAYRYLYMDAGHIGENLHLAATALGLGCCAIGAFFDDEVNAVLGVDGLEETAVYLSVVGVPA